MGECGNFITDIQAVWDNYYLKKTVEWPPVQGRVDIAEATYRTAG